MNTFTVFLVLIAIVCFLLIVVIMVQNPKGGGLDSSFGGSTVAGGVKNTNDFLDKSTWTLGAVLIILILMSSISFSGGAVGDSKLLDPNAEVPVQPATVPAAANTENTTESTPAAEAPATSETSTPETTQE
ncbi:preprotein translocase subunit SecG [Myroides sp. 1354]|uniref:preprotein translocase subunit SecG n=1 Tax=unclassified Myroides TaxID=2642485 RepID=UPI002578912D|nr:MULTISPECIES: preprotein translocase subunit SecG [unclassified Myroides]MDM1043927.1 preprotein translocase subunit SecG [Myroides sp. R163-1]MDM1054862.1 preprotein translocase subunit SecG [Myroides sp. 1354]MDM1068159.1 preprotein translocase subunit SecG [Myroides sp. 1372]